MRFISHRGNTSGRCIEKENDPDYIDETIKNGYDVEIDIWRKDYTLYLGHDYPEQIVSIDWILKRAPNLWIHCKNDNALFCLNKFKELSIFFHSNDEFTINSKNIILVNPYFETKYYNGILMMPEVSKFSLDEILKFDGIITDNIKYYENNSNFVGK